MPSINRNSPVPFYQQIYEQISRGIESGLYPVGKKLPSIREGARELGVSNTTIELAYQRLTEEGYVQARRGSGYTICQIECAPVDPFAQYPEEYRHAQEQLERLGADGDEKTTEYDFAYDAADASTFPFVTWSRISREVFFQQGADAACLYNDCQGLRELREQIAHYLNGEYGLRCTPEQLLVMPTTRDLVAEIAALFDPAETVFAMENPGYDEVGKRLTERGYRVKNLPVYPYPTWDDVSESLDDARLVFTTPACQFPSNQPMPIELRKSLVNWAKERDAYIIDDEYGWEFQSGIARTPAIAALDDAGRTVTLGTFSNSFTPAICLSYAVLPPTLMMQWKQKRRDAHPQSPWQTQAAMAAFMRDGHWRTHVRKVRTAMARKHEALVELLRHHMGDAVEIVEGASSLFVLVKVRDGRTEDELVSAAAAQGARVYPTTRYWHGAVPDDWCYVLVGYAGIPIGRLEDGVATLARAWGFEGAR